MTGEKDKAKKKKSSGSKKNNKQKPGQQAEVKFVGNGKLVLRTVKPDGKVSETAYTKHAPPKAQVKSFRITTDNLSYYPGAIPENVAKGEYNQNVQVYSSVLDTHIRNSMKRDTSHQLSIESANYSKFRLANVKVKLISLVDKNVGSYSVTLYHSLDAGDKQTDLSTDALSSKQASLSLGAHKDGSLKLNTPGGWRNTNSDSRDPALTSYGRIGCVIHGRPKSSLAGAAGTETTPDYYSGDLFRLEITGDYELRDWTKATTSSVIPATASIAESGFTFRSDDEGEAVMDVPSEFAYGVLFTANGGVKFDPALHFSWKKLGRNIGQLMLNIAPVASAFLPPPFDVIAEAGIVFVRATLAATNFSTSVTTLKLYESFEDAVSGNGITVDPSGLSNTPGSAAELTSLTGSAQNIAVNTVSISRKPHELLTGDVLRVQTSTLDFVAELTNGDLYDHIVSEVGNKIVNETVGAEITEPKSITWNGAAPVSWETANKSGNYAGALLVPIQAPTGSTTFPFAAAEGSDPYSVKAQVDPNFALTVYDDVNAVFTVGWLIPDSATSESSYVLSDNFVTVG